MTSVGLVVIATGSYQQFLPKLISSAERFLAGLTAVYVISDRRPELDTSVALHWLPWGHTDWPYPTLLRYRAMTAYSAKLSGVDFLLHIDADMEFVGPVNLAAFSDTFAVLHPGFAGKDRSLYPYESRLSSSAYIKPSSGLKYVAGGVQGGRTLAYLDACSMMAAWIQQDLDNGLIPVWHDESIWNKYCCEYPLVAILGSEYCRPDYDPGLSPRILALSKDHDRVRGISSVGRLKRSAERARRKARSYLVVIYRTVSGRS